MATALQPRRRLLSGPLRLLALAGRVILPPKCPLCGRWLAEADQSGGGLCPSCRAEVESDYAAHCPVCGDPFTSSAGGDHLCGHCLTEPPPFEAAGYVGAYQGRLAEAVKGFKYSRRTELAEPLARLLIDGRPDRFPESFQSVVPVPLHPAKLRRRGYNQALLLARRLADWGPVSAEALTRIKDTPSQAGLDRRQRTRNVKGAFAAPRPELIRGKSVLLIDDVWTTGATARECVLTLNRAGAGPIYVMTLCRVIDV